MRDDLPYKYSFYTIEDVLEFLNTYKEGWE